MMVKVNFLLNNERGLYILAFHVNGLAHKGSVTTIIAIYSCMRKLIS